MGLDITAFSYAERTKEDESNDKIYHAMSANDIDRLDGWREGFYEGRVYFNFRAGSYSGYNEWRSWLSWSILDVSPDKIWNEPEMYAGCPFVELINFGDNEGAIGPLTAAKLAKDFERYQKQVDQGDYPSWCKAKYAEWRKAFKLAAKEGLVIFH
jgi:hypothetical protein